MQLTLETLLPFLPVAIVSLTAVLVVLSLAISRGHFTTSLIAISGLGIALLSIFMLGGLDSGATAIQIGDLFVIDRTANFFMVLILLAAMVCTLLTHSFIRDYVGNREELTPLLLICTAGALTLVCSVHFASMVIGLELLSVPLFAMVAYNRDRAQSLESGVKYLVLSSSASATLLMGVALIYSSSGNMSFAAMGQPLPAGMPVMPVSLGIALVLMALAFKLSLAPFHLWTPDVYQGAPAPIGAFLATVSKVAVVAIVIRVMTEIPGSAAPWLQDGLVIVAILSVIAGNLLALRQTNLKRLLACSSIAHLGYLLTALAAGGLAATETLLVYVLTYLATTLGIFGIVAMRSSAANATDTDLISDYRGLARAQPWLGGIMAVMLLSLAGIPLTAGFIGKLYIFVNGVQAQQWALLAAVIIGSTVGLAYYLRVLVTLFLPVTGASSAAAEPAPRPFMLAILAGLALVVLWLGTWPQPALEFVRSLSATLPV